MSVAALVCCRCQVVFSFDEYYPVSQVRTGSCHHVVARGDM